MTLKKFLAVPLVISVVFFAYYSKSIIRDFDTLLGYIHIDNVSVLGIIVSVILLVFGHIVRAYKMKFMIKPVIDSTTRFQFRALSIGYLFNTLLPLRLGELVRAQIIAGGEKISYGFALTAIVIERIIDVVLLAIYCILLAIFGFLSFGRLGGLLPILLLALSLLIVLVLAVRRNSLTLRVWKNVTKIFNGDISTSLRFKAWSIIYGVQRIFTPKRFVVYICLTIVSWVIYITSIGLIILVFLPDHPGNNILQLTVAPFLGISIPAGPANLGTYSESIHGIVDDSFVTQSSQLAFNIVSWSIITLPMSLIGLLLIPTKTKEKLWRSLPRQSSTTSLSNKLQRTEDVSAEMSAFLDNFFSGSDLSKVVHNLELGNDFRLVKYFKGGSDAITILALQSGREIVKKIIPIALKDRLLAQYEWLHRRQKGKGIVRALDDYTTNDYYAIDLGYDRNDTMFFDFMHTKSLGESKKIIDKVWQILHDQLYSKTEYIKDEQALKTYIDKHIYGCLEKAISVSSPLAEAVTLRKIVINGTEYDNFEKVMSRITKNKRAMHDLSTYAKSVEVHGDVTVDNILVGKKNQPLLIDPAPDGNIINGPVFDFGKNMQSFYCGYEFIFRNPELVVLEGNTINYTDQRSMRYVELCEYIRNEITPKYLSDGERRSIIFHAGALHIRRLKHQVYQSPDNVLAIYAVGIRALNDFIDQYT